MAKVDSWSQGWGGEISLGRDYDKSGKTGKGKELGQPNSQLLRPLHEVCM